VPQQVYSECGKAPDSDKDEKRGKKKGEWGHMERNGKILSYLEKKQATGCTLSKDGRLGGGLNKLSKRGEKDE